jgi:hypothetical protein
MSLRRNTRPARHDWLTEELAVALADALADVPSGVGDVRCFMGG